MKSENFDRFDLEEALLSLYHICLDYKLTLSEEEKAAALNLHELRCDKAFEIFDDLVQRGKIQ